MCPQTQTARSPRDNSSKYAEELAVYDSSKEHQLRRIPYDPKSERLFDCVNKLGFRVVCLSAEPAESVPKGKAVCDIDAYEASLRQQRMFAERIGIYGLFDKDGKPVKDEKGEEVKMSADTGQYWVRYEDATREDQRKFEKTIRPPKLLDRREMIPTEDIGRAFVCHRGTVDSLLKQAFTPVEVKDLAGKVVYTVKPQSEEYLAFYRARRANINLVYNEGVLHMRFGKEDADETKQTAAFWPGAGQKYSGVSAAADFVPSGVIYQLERLLREVEAGSNGTKPDKGDNKQRKDSEDWKNSPPPIIMRC
jgi:hypothetical protein